MRRTDQFDAEPISGTVGGAGPFFSPDGEWIGFSADGMLKKVPTSDGPPLIICPASALKGGAWADDGNIYFAPDSASGIWKVSAAGGKPVAVTRLDRARDEISHRWPQLLPGGKHRLVTTKTPLITSFDDGRIAVVSLADGSIRTLIEGGTDGRFLPSEYLVFARGNRLYGVRFDTERMLVQGAPVAILNSVFVSDGTGAAYSAFAKNGSLVYVPRTPRSSYALFWVDRQGMFSEVSTGERQLVQPRLSPDGRMVAGTLVGANNDIGLLDVTRGTVTRLSFDPGNETPFNEMSPKFSPDGRWLAYQSNESGRNEIYIRSMATGGGRWQVSDEGGIAPRWSPDGRGLFYWNANHFYSVEMVVRKQVSVGKPQRFAVTEESAASGFPRDFDVASDGRLVAPRVQSLLAVSQLNFVTNWFEDVRRRTTTELKR